LHSGLGAKDLEAKKVKASVAYRTSEILLVAKKGGKMRIGSACLVLFWFGSSVILLGQTNANAAFDRLKTLSGDWEGTVAWTGQTPSKIGAHYYTTGNDSALVENLSNGMTSVYHLDGADLRMTHFFAAQNQPRLKATAFGPNNSSIRFSLVDITNLGSPGAGHIDGVEMRFLAADHITLHFYFVAEGKEKDELLDLKRRK
jgi:hypothetical protein